MNFEEFYRNAYGIKIKRCCASCKHHRQDTDSHRICLQGYGQVLPSFLCSDRYEMIEDFEKAGKGDGFVKKKHYFRYLVDFQQPENPSFRFSLDEIRKEYIEKFGSVFVDNKQHIIPKTNRNGRKNA